MTSQTAGFDVHPHKPVPEYWLFVPGRFFIRICAIFTFKLDLILFGKKSAVAVYIVPLTFFQGLDDPDHHAWHRSQYGPPPDPACHQTGLPVQGGACL